MGARYAEIQSASFFLHGARELRRDTRVNPRIETEADGDPSGIFEIEVLARASRERRFELLARARGDASSSR